MPMPHDTYEERLDLIYSAIGFATLDGKPARIGAAREKFASVYEWPCGASAQFSWDAVARILANDGAFRTR